MNNISLVLTSSSAPLTLKRPQYSAKNDQRPSQTAAFPKFQDNSWNISLVVWSKPECIRDELKRQTETRLQLQRTCSCEVRQREKINEINRMENPPRLNFYRKMRQTALLCVSNHILVAPAGRNGIAGAFCISWIISTPELYWQNIWPTNQLSDGLPY
jgi:hypothetical protein